MKNKSIPFEEFEKAVMQRMLARETSVNRVLREQYNSAVILKREFTGVGFFTDLEIPETIIRITEPVDMDMAAPMQVLMEVL